MTPIPLASVTIASRLFVSVMISSLDDPVAEENCAAFERKRV
jgi:hypothetical protein